MRGSWSLRTRVALVSAAVAALVAITLGFTYAALLAVAGSRQLDQTVSTMRVQVAADDGLFPPVPITAAPARPLDPADTIVVPDTALAPVQGAPGLIVKLRADRELVDAAITRMLARLETAHGETRQALASARDFAAVCAHELRTPLTAMRTDLQVLAGPDLPADQRGAVLADVLAAESPVASCSSSPTRSPMPCTTAGPPRSPSPPGARAPSSRSPSTTTAPVCRTTSPPPRSTAS